jgi:hypothetical protein
MGPAAAGERGFGRRKSLEENLTMRGVRFGVLSLMIAALGVIVVIPAAAEDPIDISAGAQGISVPHPGTVTSDVAYQGLAATNVTVGIASPGVPCGNCVRNAGQPNIGLPWPVFDIAQGARATITVLFESQLYTGACTAGIILQQNGKPIATGHYPFPGGCLPHYLYAVWFPISILSSPGFTSVIGVVAGGGTNKSGADTLINIQ